MSFTIEVSSFDSSDTEAFDSGLVEGKSVDKVLFDCENENMSNDGIITREITIDMTKTLILLYNMNESILNVFQI